MLDKKQNDDLSPTILSRYELPNYVTEWNTSTEIDQLFLYISNDFKPLEKEFKKNICNTFNEKLENMSENDIETVLFEFLEDISTDDKIEAMSESELEGLLFQTWQN